MIRGKQPPTPEFIWWDSGFCASLPIHKPPHEDARLLMLFLDFIFSIQFGFYPTSTAMDHIWLISGLCTNKARYHSALSVSACFDASLRESEKIDGIGLSLEVTERQAIASCDLRAMIAHFNQQRHGPRDAVRIGMQILEVMHQLLSLEIFRKLEGTWELHHQATRTGILPVSALIDIAGPIANSTKYSANFLDIVSSPEHIPGNGSYAESLVSGFEDINISILN